MAARWKDRLTWALGALYLLVAAAAWSVWAQIEWAWHTDHPYGQYTAAIQVKGATRYVTPDQALWDHVAKTVFVADVLAFFLVLGVYNWLKGHRPSARGRTRRVS